MQLSLLKHQKPFTLTGGPGKLAIPISGDQSHNSSRLLHLPPSKAWSETGTWVESAMEELTQCGKSSSSLGQHPVWIGNKLSTTGALTGFESPSTENLPRGYVWSWCRQIMRKNEIRWHQSLAPRGENWKQPILSSYEFLYLDSGQNIDNWAGWGPHTFSAF